MTISDTIEQSLDRRINELNQQIYVQQQVVTELILMKSVITKAVTTQIFINKSTKQDQA